MEKPLCPDEPGFRIIETFARRDGAFPRLDRHLARMGRTARALGIAFDAAAVRALLPDEGELRCRLTLDRAGRAEITTAPLGAPAGDWRVMIAEPRLRAGDPWLRMKTTRRALYDETRAALPGGIDEALFLNERGELCEGTITNLFLQRDGELLTPPVASGLLPGVLRESLLESGECSETVLTAGDLASAEALYVGNSLRGLIRATLVRDAPMP
ncbi:aminotransferase class IV family protein [Poseidonocella sedimentorum]|uniref:Probable branched-chain-amino-acid aminotransferase n=1 Tax=Poseidonocella sedimentorum TaxID=871652 RepID=A0A1I6E0B7_9RHOB|nr:aminotransferase class IV family protein [Poseidonocella sedimentorum]SFR11022.1 4-amino-4-deoxychorismate lyase [Poseidonocella sedimentorum]